MDINIVPCMANQKKECVITVGSMMIFSAMKMKRSTVKMKKCSICEQMFIPGYGKGNNAMPVNDGYCCDDCDREVVTPSRLAIGEIVRKHWRNLSSG